MHAVYKGELAAVGIHKSMMSGIHSDAARDEGAFAIVMSGGYICPIYPASDNIFFRLDRYKDDDDTGNGFDYTGMGGQVAHLIKASIYVFSHLFSTF